MREDVFLREQLAVQRTILANERTFLAYIRTAIALVAAGASAIYFLEPLALQVIGWSMVAAAVGTLVLGLSRFRRVRAVIESIAPSDDS